jgi:putative transposase
MKFDPERHHRRSVRLKRYDYTGGNVYFVTICAYQKECLFGTIDKGEINLNTAGECVRKAWLGTADKRTNIRLDDFVIMPNHFHGILWLLRRGTACRAHEIHDEVNILGAASRAPTFEQFGKPVHDSLPTIIRSFKSAATKLINESRNTPGSPIWQRNYYEHVIRSHKELRQTSEYIRSNPAHWHNDEENPVNF